MIPSHLAGPPPDFIAAQANRRAICEPRGYCGPFVNEEYFASFAEPLWRGCGNCIICGNTVNVAHELEKWERALWHREFGIRLTSSTQEMAAAS